MKCIMCDNKQNLKRQTTTVKYKDCGLDNVTLYGVEFFKCDQCGEIYYGYGDTEKLHSAIAEILILNKDLLSGKEIRFLRTYLGYSGAVFARLTGYTKESISRMENGKQNIVKPFDRLVRYFVSTKLPHRDYDLQDLWLKDEGKSLKRIELKAHNNNWVLKEAA